MRLQCGVFIISPDNPMGILAGIARREKKRAPMELQESAVISASGGVADDFRGKPGKRQVTLLSARDWAEACAELGTDVPWTARRSNLLIADMDLPKEAGRIVCIGDVRLRTTIEIDPCSRMDEAAPGLKAALQSNWRGGVGCEVLHGGHVSVGDEVRLEDADT
jgi:MOSC domain-containing protein YiiM